MALFKDSKYENLDWISQATEPMESSMAEILSKMPDKIDMDFDVIKKHLNSSWGMSIEVKSIVWPMIKEISNSSLSYEEMEMINNCFALETDGDVIIDFRNSKMSGSVSLVKIKNTFEDKELEDLLGGKGLSELRSSIYYSGFDFGRATDVMEIIGSVDPAFYRTRSPRRKAEFMFNRVRKLLKDNEWNIKSMELADKVPTWIGEYVVRGNLAAYANFCKLKVMTHKGVAIYSMEEHQ